MAAVALPPLARPPVSLDRLLGLTSHTFSLAIRLLPEPLRREITIAYLLFRAADTLEDSEILEPAARIQALSDLGRVLRETASPWHCPGPGPWVHSRVTDHDGCKRLLAALPELLQALRETGKEARAAIIHRVGGTIDGMIWYQLRSGRPTEIEIADIDDLRRYSYVVAGVVGELLTDLFVLRCRLGEDELPELQSHALALGEGFQLVNILKDVPDDAKGGRNFLPPEIDIPALIALARRDLSVSEAYSAVLKRAHAPRGILAFLWFTVKLARRSLDKVEEGGLGVKMAKDEVVAHLATATSYCET